MILLGLLLTALAGPAEGPVIGSPRLARGDELVYVGTVEEAGERVDNRFRKRHDLTVRVFVLEAADGFADCAVLTLVRPRFDPVVAGPAASVTGSDPARKPSLPAVRLDLVRVDPRGRVRMLAPRTIRSPLDLTPQTPTATEPLASLETAPDLEVGLFVPLPAKPVSVGTTWETAEPGRPPVVWIAAREAVWNGGRCIEVTATQQTDGWDRPALAATGWRRTDVRLVAPADGFASHVTRRVERREGASLVGWTEVAYEARPTSRAHGARYADVRREIETALVLAADLDAALARGGAPDRKAFQVRLARIDQYLADQTFRTGFRDAVEAVRRRCAAAANGDAPSADPVVRTGHTEQTDPPAVGRPAPDFVAPRLDRAEPFRLSAVRGKPAVLVFFKPGSRTAADSLRVAEALDRAFDSRATVAAVAIARPEIADRQREQLRLTVPVLDGAGVRNTYGVETYPKFFIVDAAGLVVWQFDGYGAETGYLVKKELEKLVK